MEKFRSGHCRAELVILEFRSDAMTEIAVVQEKIRVAMLEAKSALHSGNARFTTPRVVLAKTNEVCAKTSSIIGPRVLNSHLRGTYASRTGET